MSVTTSSSPAYSCASSGKGLEYNDGPKRADTQSVETRIRRVLFVCTGNVFRSMTAEYAVRRAVGVQPAGVAVAQGGQAGRYTSRSWDISSAGTLDEALIVWPVVRDHLRTHGLDVNGHARRTLTRSLLDDADLVVAMSTEHQRELAECFSYRAPLYTDLAGFPGEPLPDVDEAVPDYRTNLEGRTVHVRRTIDRIVALAPAFARRLEEKER
jgi:protein-tyrosine phosphatase